MRKPRVAVVKVGRAGASARGTTREEPLIPKRLWRKLPEWLTLPNERGRSPRCIEGHKLVSWKQNRARYGECYECDSCPKAGTSLLVCHECNFFLCEGCNKGMQRMPPIQADMLFLGPRNPRLLQPVGASTRGTGTIIVCPGGNYEFLASHEAWPVLAVRVCPIGKGPVFCGVVCVFPTTPPSRQELSF